MRRATIHLSHEELRSFGMGELVSVFLAAGLRAVEELQCRRPGCLLAVTVEAPVDEADLSALDDVEWWERIDGDDEVTYLCKVAVPAFDEGLDPFPETDVAPDGLTVADDGIEVTMVGSHEALADRIDEFADAGTDVLLRTLADYDGPADPLGELTDRQREVLETAVEMGYFQVPRETTTEAVGEALSLDPSTVREHLQRAQHNLFSELLSG